MDPTAVNVNVTVDDFDSVLKYDRQAQWQTPDPSNPSFDPSSTPWVMGTYHQTSEKNATLRFNFTGPAIYIYGGSGPSYGSYEIQIDGWTGVYSASAPQNASTAHLLFGSSNLTYASHQLVLRNLGARGNDTGDTFLFDSLQTTIQLAKAGATVANTTYQEDDPALKYDGKWDSNKSPNFSGGGSSYTQADKASVSLSFRGTAVYVFGDKKNDHGLYSVVLDNRTAEVFSGESGCGGAFGMTCEQMKPTLEYLASNLDDSLHTLRIENLAGVNNSFFDLDSIVVTVPSQYSPRVLDVVNASSSPFAAGASLPPGTSSSTGSAAPGVSGSSTPNNNNSAVALAGVSPLLLLLIFGVSWLLGPSARR